MADQNKKASIKWSRSLNWAANVLFKEKLNLFLHWEWGDRFITWAIEDNHETLDEWIGKLLPRITDRWWEWKILALYWQPHFVWREKKILIWCNLENQNCMHDWDLTGRTCSFLIEQRKNIAKLRFTERWVYIIHLAFLHALPAMLPKQCTSESGAHVSLETSAN